MNIFCKFHIHNDSKKVFRPILNSMRVFKNAILPELKNFLNGTFKPCMEFKKNFGRKTSVKRYEDNIYKKKINMSQDPPNPGCR